MNQTTPQSGHTSISIHELNQLIAQSLLSPNLKETVTKNLVQESKNRQITAAGVDKAMTKMKAHHVGTTEAGHIETLHTKLSAHLDQGTSGLGRPSQPTHPSIAAKL